MSKTHKVVSLSGIYLDVYGTGFPFTDSLGVETQTTGSDYTVKPGGSGTIFSSVIKKLGTNAMLIGQIGTDLFGSVIHEDLVSRGIDFRAQKTEDHKTNVSFNLTNEAGRNILLTVGDANQALTPEIVDQLAMDQLSSADMIYLGSVFKLPQLHAYLRVLIDKLKNNGVKVIIDHGRLTNHVTEQNKEDVKKLVSQSDYYIPNRYEFSELWQVSASEGGIRQLQVNMPHTTIIVTKDKDGALGISPDGSAYHSVPASINPVNTIGAGDTFNAGFAYALLKGDRFDKAMQFAQKCAEYKIEHQQYPRATDIK